MSYKILNFFGEQVKGKVDRCETKRKGTGDI